MSIEEQTREVDKVKRSENGIIVDPITLPPDATVGQARNIMNGHNISGVPITVSGYLRCILTRRDLRFLVSNDLRIEEVMTKENLVTAPANTSLEEADRILTKNKVEKLLLVDDEYRLIGLVADSVRSGASRRRVKALEDRLTGLEGEIRELRAASFELRELTGRQAVSPTIFAAFTMHRRIWREELRNSGWWRPL